MANTPATAILIWTPELLGSLASMFKNSAIAEFTSTPNAFFKKFGFDIKADIKLVSNQADTVNLALPFYSDLQKSAGAQLSDEDLEIVSGGYTSFTARAINNIRSLREAWRNSTTPEETAAAERTLIEAQQEFVIQVPGGIFLLSSI